MNAFEALELGLVHISAGLLLGLDRVSAARFSFLLSVPAVVLAGLFELKGLVDGSATGPAPALGVTALATLVAFVVATRRSPCCCAS